MFLFTTLFLLVGLQGAVVDVDATQDAHSEINLTHNKPDLQSFIGALETLFKLECPITEDKKPLWQDLKKRSNALQANPNAIAELKLMKEALNFYENVKSKAQDKDDDPNRVVTQQCDVNFGASVQSWPITGSKEEPKKEQEKTSLWIDKPPDGEVGPAPPPARQNDVTKERYSDVGLLRQQDAVHTRNISDINHNLENVWYAIYIVGTISVIDLFLLGVFISLIRTRKKTN